MPVPSESASFSTVGASGGSNRLMTKPRQAFAFIGGAAIGALGGLIGLGGAEFRLPLLIGPFRFRALEAVILNKAMSFIVVATALPFRAAFVPFAAVASNWPIILNLLAGSLVGAWLGAGWATKLSSRNLYRILAVLLALIAGGLVFGHGATATSAHLSGLLLIVAGVVAGFGIGIVASLMGVRGRRAADSDSGAALRRRHQARRQPLARREPADHDRRLHSLQPRQRLWRRDAQQGVCPHHGVGLDSGNFHRRTSSRDRVGPALDPGALPDSRGIVGEGLAPRVNRRECPLFLKTTTSFRLDTAMSPIGAAGRSPFVWPRSAKGRVPRSPSRARRTWTERLSSFLGFRGLFAALDILRPA